MHVDIQYIILFILFLFEISSSLNLLGMETYHHTYHFIILKTIYIICIFIAALLNKSLECVTKKYKYKIEIVKFTYLKINLKKSVTNKHAQG